MILINGKRICDCEVGSPKKGWRGCGEKAVCVSHNIVRGTFLDWCERHRKKAFIDGHKLYKELCPLPAESKAE
jgi:hypothetical protein